MRGAIDKHSRRFKDVLSGDSIRKEFLKASPKNDAKVVKAFVAANASNALKTRPKVRYPSISLLFQRDDGRYRIHGRLLMSMGAS